MSGVIIHNVISSCFAQAAHPARRDRLFIHDDFELRDHPLSRLMTEEGVRR